MPLVTPEDVGTLLAEAVSAGDILRAEIIVGIEAGVEIDDIDPDDTAISSRNLRNLAKAVALQAVFVRDHPDIFSVMDVQGVSQDGLSAQYASQSAMYLAPLAARLIRRLSWKLAPLRVGRRRSAGFIDVGNRDDAVRDDDRTWDPISSSGRAVANPLAGRSGQTWR